jgi:hypothetical protein
VNAQSAPDLDPDKDGMTNLQEYRMGTNPTDPTDALKLTLTSRSENGVRLRWFSALGRKYVLESSITLKDDDWSAVGEIVEGNGDIVEGVDLSRTEALFYRVRIAP